MCCFVSTDPFSTGAAKLDSIKQDRGKKAAPQGKPQYEQNVVKRIKKKRIERQAEYKQALRSIH